MTRRFIIILFVFFQFSNFLPEVFAEEDGGIIEVEKELLPAIKEGLQAFERFLADDLILEIIAFQKSHDPAQVEILKDLFIKRGQGRDDDDLMREHQTLHKIFGEFPIYKEWKQRVKILFEVGHLSESRDVKSFEKLISQIEDPDFKAILESSWKRIEEEKKKREELMALTGSYEIDFERYARPWQKNYYETVNRIYPGMKRAFCLALYHDLKNSIWKDSDLAPISKRLQKEEFGDSDKDFILKFYENAREREALLYQFRVEEQGIRFGFKKEDPWTTMTGAPATTAPFLS
ncbi:MAG: hypothetical protein AAB309_06935, partial [Deltaproteobacteria bacterium]